MKKKWIRVLILALIALVSFGTVLAFAQNALPNEAEPAAGVLAQPTQPSNITDNGLLYLAAALAVGVASIAAGMAVSAVGAAALGTISEKPELMGRALIFVGLAEGIAIYGLIVAIMILGKA